MYKDLEFDIIQQPEISFFNYDEIEVEQDGIAISQDEYYYLKNKEEIKRVFVENYGGDVTKIDLENNHIVVYFFFTDDQINKIWRGKEDEYQLDCVLDGWR